MIYLSFGLSNPWGRPFDNLWNRSGLITNHMAWEVELCVVKTLIGFEINYTRRQDHAGPVSYTHLTLPTSDLV